MTGSKIKVQHHGVLGFDAQYRHRIAAPGSPAHARGVADGILRKNQQHVTYLRDNLLATVRPGQVVVEVIRPTSKFMRELSDLLAAHSYEIGLELNCAVRICNGECAECQDGRKLAAGMNIFALENQAIGLCSSLQRKIHKDAEDPRKHR